MSITKNELLNWYSSMKKKIEKDSDNFWYRKLTLKVGRLSDFALFDTSPLEKFSKFKNFLLLCWFLGKNLSNFLDPVWKLHNPYCHNGCDRNKNYDRKNFDLCIVIFITGKFILARTIGNCWFSEKKKKNT